MHLKFVLLTEVSLGKNYLYREQHHTSRSLTFVSLLRIVPQYGMIWSMEHIEYRASWIDTS